MASPSPLLDIEENFFICPVCLDYFKEPKLLPCLHRFCKHCLHGIIEEKHGAFECPMCNHPCTATSNGVEEFKTDFYMKSILEFIQLQRTFEQKDGRKCVSCSQKKKVEAYCFECGDVLCNQCYQFHSTNKMFIKHQQHLLNVKNIGVKGLTLEKLASVTGAPRCNTHAGQIAQLLCGTCGNVSICVACTYGIHKGHEFHEVTTLARAQREDLIKKMKKLDKYKDKLYELPQKIEVAKRKLEENALREKDRLKSQHERQVLKNDDDVRQNDKVLEQRRTEVTKNKEGECSRLRREYEEKIERLRKECEKTVQETERKYDSEYQHAESEHNKIQAELLRKRGSFEGDFNNSIEVIDEQKTLNVQELKEIFDHTNHTITRYENVTATSSAVLVSKNDWLDAQCIPDIGAAYEPLITDVEKEFTKLESLSVIPPMNVSPAVVDKVTITDHEISVIEFKGGKGWNHIDLATCGDSSIVITSKAPDEYTYNTVLNIRGQILRQKKLKGDRFSWRFCCRLTQFKIATVTQGTEIGIYDIRDGTYIRENVTLSSTVSCITTNSVNTNILVGCYRSNIVHVFDDKLNHLYNLLLPNTPERLLDISMYERKLLICDHKSRAYATSIEGQNVRLLNEFTKPHHGECCYSMSVCADSNGFIYILRSDKMWIVGYTGARAVAQYSRDGHQLLKTRQVEGDARHVRILKDEEGEKLLVTTITTGKVYVYGLTAS